MSREFGDLAFTNQANIHPLGVVLLAIGVAVILFGRRRAAICATLSLLVLVSPGQRVLVGGVDLQFLRIAGIALLLRSICRREFRGVTWAWVDFCFFLYAVLPVLAAMLRGSWSSLGPRTGVAADIGLMYACGRALLSSEKDWQSFARANAVLVVPVSVSMIVEKTTGRNLFSLFGGVPEYTAVRDGSLRAQGAFAHPIIAGVWWAMVMPAMLYSRRVDRGQVSRAVLGFGLVMSGLCCFLTASSTPIGAMCFVVVFWSLYRWRVLVGQCAPWVGLGAVVLHFLTTSGIHGLLLGRIAFVSGSTGYYRYKLIDEAAKRIGEWWMIGVESTAGWAWGMIDLPCQYVAAGVFGGIWTLVALVTALVLCVRAAFVVSIWAPRTSCRLLGWSLLTALLGHALAFVAVYYFGQGNFLFPATLGGAVSVSACCSGPGASLAAVGCR